MGLNREIEKYSLKEKFRIGWSSDIFTRKTDIGISKILPTMEVEPVQEICTNLMLGKYTRKDNNVGQLLECPSTQRSNQKLTCWIQRQGTGKPALRAHLSQNMRFFFFSKKSSQPLPLSRVQSKDHGIAPGCV